jgi:hypothetical protein
VRRTKKKGSEVPHWASFYVSTDPLFSPFFLFAECTLWYGKIQTTTEKTHKRKKLQIGHENEAKRRANRKRHRKQTNKQKNRERERESEGEGVRGESDKQTNNAPFKTSRFAALMLPLVSPPLPPSH